MYDISNFFKCTNNNDNDDNELLMDFVQILYTYGLQLCNSNGQNQISNPKWSRFLAKIEQVFEDQINQLKMLYVNEMQMEINVIVLLNDVVLHGIQTKKNQQYQISNVRQDMCLI